MASHHYLDKILQRITENTNTMSHVGIIIASPSEDPPYKYHWVRDSALVMRTFIDMYKKTKNPLYFQYIINYLENESKIQELNTISGLGEPKYNIDCTAFNGEWGRPQNDGPALRGIMLFKIISLFQYKYDKLIENLILPILVKDINYICKNIENTSFDLWEEINGWHFYTRMVQLKFLKDALKHKKLIVKLCDFVKIMDSYVKLSSSVKDHICDNHIISSLNIIKSLIYNNNIPIMLICSFKNKEDIILLDELHKIQFTYKNFSYKISLIYNKDTNNLNRFKTGKTINIINKILPDLSNHYVYIKGSLDFLNENYKKVEDLGAKKENIYNKN